MKMTTKWILGAGLISTQFGSVLGADKPITIAPELQQRSYVAASIDKEKAAEALSAEGRILKPLKVQAHARGFWNATNVKFKKGEWCLIQYTGGTWSVDPEKGTNGPAGNGSVHKRPGYTVVGEPEGCLLAKLGVNGKIMVLKSGVARIPVEGPDEFTELFLAANDDWEKKYGKGESDNYGSLELEINVERPK